MNKEDLYEQITAGREFATTLNSPGFQQILMPRLKALLEKADKDCHNFRLREDRGKYAIVKYNTIKDIMKLFDDIVTDMERALDYCEKHNIKI